MEKPIRVQLSRRKGFRLDEAAGNGLPTVKVDRTTKWGNPFTLLGYKGPFWRELAVMAFREWIYDTNRSELGLPATDELRGKNLACWCPLPKPGEPDYCHAAVLLEIANAPTEGETVKEAR